MTDPCERQPEFALAANDHAAFVRWVYGLFGFVPTADDCARPVFATPYPGCYGHAGYVLTINGSPPRATIVVEPASGQMVAIRNNRVIRGNDGAGASRAAERRYRDALAWLERFGLPAPEQGA